MGRIIAVWAGLSLWAGWCLVACRRAAGRVHPHMACPHLSPSFFGRLVRVDKSILVGCMTQVVHAFHLKGKKLYSIYMPAAISTMQLLSISKTRNARPLRQTRTQGCTMELSGVLSAPNMEHHLI